MKDGGPAFPKTGSFNNDGPPDCDSFDQEGMSLRDYFAAAALVSMLNNPQTFDEKTPELAAKWAYKIADAMLAEREKGS